MWPRLSGLFYSYGWKAGVVSASTTVLPMRGTDPAKQYSMYVTRASDGATTRPVRPRDIRTKHA